jgi:ribonuclease BN (tRNA processing enzyme)
MFDVAFRSSEYRPEAPFTAAGFEVAALAVEHYGFSAWGLRIADTQGRTLAYSGDSGPCESLLTLADGADLFLCEATLASGESDAKPRGHLSAEEALAFAAGQLLLTHRPIELSVPPGSRQATDGLVVEV